MNASKFSDAQKAFILKQGDDGVSVAEICRKSGISQAAYFNWRKKYGGLLPDEMRRLKAPEDEMKNATGIYSRRLLIHGICSNNFKLRLVRSISCSIGNSGPESAS
jgi:putative transposase